MAASNEIDAHGESPRKHPVLRWVVLVSLIALGVLIVVAEVVVRHAEPILKGRVISSLSARFQSKVELDSLDVSVVKGLEISGGGLRIYAPDDMVAAGATNPVIAVRSFEFHANLKGLFLKPMHTGTVYLQGLEIHIPPRQARQAAGVRPAHHGEKIKIVVDHFLCEDSALVIDNGDPAKEPKRFALDRIELWQIGADDPWRYDATLVNAIPKGDIHASGTFGPWVNESPGEARITGHYTFDNADLYPIKGIGGTLSSIGDFHGQLNHIEVQGTTDTPNFSLDSANQPMPLKTAFQAVVDGTTGDTYLTDVQAKLKNTAMHCTGSVVNLKGKGHAVDVDVDIPNGRLEDLLGLAIKTRPVYMTAGIATKAHLHVRPGKESVIQKVVTQGGFTLRGIHFTNPKVQDRIDDLSLRAQGRPAEAKPGAPVAASQMTGDFKLHDGKLDFDQLNYTVPGAAVALTGIYSLNGEQFDFHGTVRTQAQLSEMVSPWWQQLLLKPVDRFFRKNGAGTEVPIKIVGTDNEPKFGLDFGHDKK